VPAGGCSSALQAMRCATFCCVLLGVALDTRCVSAADASCSTHTMHACTSNTNVCAGVPSTPLLNLSHRTVWVALSDCHALTCICSVSPCWCSFAAVRPGLLLAPSLVVLMGWTARAMSRLWPPMPCCRRQPAKGWSTLSRSDKQQQPWHLIAGCGATAGPRMDWSIGCCLEIAPLAQPRDSCKSAISHHHQLLEHTKAVAC